MKAILRKTGDVHEKCGGKFLRLFRDIKDGYMACDKCKMLQFSTKEERDYMELNKFYEAHYQ